MAQKMRDVMTTAPSTVDASDPIAAAAAVMARENIGDVIVTDGKRICGIVTDRDIAVRGVAHGLDASTQVGAICSGHLTTTTQGVSVDRAVELMRAHAVRRLPVVDKGRPIGIVSLGDLAQRRDRNSALAKISGAPPNR